MTNLELSVNPAYLIICKQICNAKMAFYYSCVVSQSVLCYLSCMASQKLFAQMDHCMWGFFAHCGNLVLINQNHVLNLSSDFSQVVERTAELLFQSRTEPQSISHTEEQSLKSLKKKNKKIKISVRSVPWCECPVLTAE